MAGHTQRSDAVGELMVQHARLRDMIARCDQLAGALERGAIGAVELLDEVTRLRIALAAHNQREEQLLRPLLLEPISPDLTAGAPTVDDAHVREHHAIERALDDEMSGQMSTGMGTGMDTGMDAGMDTGMDTGTYNELRRVLGSLRAHLDAEDRLFSAARAWPDELGCR